MTNDLDSAASKSADAKPRRQTGSSSKRPGRGGQGDDRRKRRPSGAATPRGHGFNDGLDHALCLHYRHLLPHEFPPQDRPGLATLQPAQVATRAGGILFCDRQHPGPCAWPDGEPTTQPPLDPSQT